MSRKFEEDFAKAMKTARVPRTIHGLPADARYTGTCQACFGTYVVKRHGRKLTVVLHGYERPGSGYIVGECPGRDEEPFELAKDVTERFRALLLGMLADAERRLAEFKTNLVSELYVEVTGTNLTQRKETKKRMILIRPGWKNPDPMFYGDDWLSRLKIAINKTEARRSGITRDLRLLENKLATWRYDPQALAHAEERAQAEKTAKTASKKAITDEKEAKEEAVLAAFLDNPQLVAYLKNKPYMVFNKTAGWGYTPSGRSEYEEVILRRTRSRTLSTCFGSRSFSRRQLISDLRSQARDARVKISAPKW